MGPCVGAGEILLVAGASPSQPLLVTTVDRAKFRIFVYQDGAIAFHYPLQKAVRSETKPTANRRRNDGLFELLDSHA